MMDSGEAVQVLLPWSLTPSHRQTQRHRYSGHRQKGSRLHFDTHYGSEIEGERGEQTHPQQRRTREKEENDDEGCGFGYFE